MDEAASGSILVRLTSSLNRLLEAPARRATWEAREGPRKGPGGPERPERPEWRLTSGEVLRVLLLRSRHGQRGEGMRRVRDVVGGAFEDDRLGFTREMDGDRGVGHQVAHPARLRRSVEAKRAADPDAIDGPRMRPSVWTYRRDPVIGRGPGTLLDVAPGQKAVRSSRRAVRSRRADRTNGGRFAGHSCRSRRRPPGSTGTPPQPGCPFGPSPALPLHGEHPDHAALRPVRLRPANVVESACIRCASTPQPDCTATYWTPSAARS